MADVYGANLYHRHLRGRSGDSPAPRRCESILVCTGVYGGRDPRESATQTAFHGHRDFRLDPGLVEAAHVVRDAEDAVELVLKEEDWGR